MEIHAVKLLEKAQMNQFHRIAWAVVSRLNVGTGQGYTRDAEVENTKRVADELEAVYKRAVTDAESAVIALYAQAGPHASGTHYAVAIRHLLKEEETGE